MTPLQRAEAAWEHAMREAERIDHRKRDRAVRDRIFRLERIVDAIGTQLARSPNDRELGRLFHLASDKLHQADTAENETRLAENEPLARTANGLLELRKRSIEHF
jgi:hypothetical protein